MSSGEIKSTNITKSLKNSNRGRISFVESIEEEPPPENENTSQLKRNTPILFSTNRGLHLRMASLNQTHTPSSSNNLSLNSSYNMAFCDLERWSTNRANTVSLEDTFTVAKSPVVPLSGASGSLACNSLRFLPQKSTTIRFHGYSRFDVE